MRDVFRLPHLITHDVLNQIPVDPKTIRRLLSGTFAPEFDSARGAIDRSNAWHDGYEDCLYENGWTIRDGPLKFRCESCKKPSW